MKKLYRKAVEAYYAGKPIMTDAEFDKLENKIRAADPDWVGFRSPGTNRIKKHKVRLAYLMPSLSKCYPHQIDSWVTNRKGPWIAMPKLDGSSVQAVYRGGRLQQLVTRGNGTIGQDITFLAQYTRLPQMIATKKEFVVRCEAILAKKTWQKKYSKISENPRNLVAGILNRKLDKDSTDQLQYVHFVVLGVFGLPLVKGLERAQELGFEVVHYSKLVPDALKLSAMLAKVRETYRYETDGLVVAPSGQVFAYESSEKPKWATAFKENLDEDEAPVTTVKNVIWQISHTGRWTPKIEIEPTRLDGVTVKYATAHNFSWMYDRGIGVGAVVRIVRSGGVIPKIIAIDKPAKNLTYPSGTYERRGVHLYAKDYSDDQAVKKLAKFLDVLEVEGVKAKTVQKLYDAGMRSLYDLVEAISDDRILNKYLLRAISGDATRTMIASEFKKCRKLTLKQAILASSVFREGIGERRLSLIQQHFPLANLLRWDRSGYDQHLSTVPGFGSSTINTLYKGMQKYKYHHKEWVRLITIKDEKKGKEVTGKWSGVNATWTGYRSKDEETEWTKNGGQIVPFGNKTNVLFYREGGKPSSKLDKARDKGVQILTWAQRKEIK